MIRQLEWQGIFCFKKQAPWRRKLRGWKLSVASPKFANFLNMLVNALEGLEKGGRDDII